MKTFTEPTFELIQLQNEDILCSSGCPLDANTSCPTDFM